MMNERKGNTIDPGWKAQIVKSTDGGVTWKSLFFDEGNFYFNQIDCADTDHCCAVGEADQSALPGIRIYCTEDGTTFNQVYFNGDADFSIMAIQSISLLEWWASGGDMSPGGFIALMVVKRGKPKPFPGCTVMQCHSPLQTSDSRRGLMNSLRVSS